MSGQELGDILEVSRRNNEARGITGMLLYLAGTFLQVLEGPREEIEPLIETIRCDERHSGIRVLLEGPLPARSFGGWSMGFLNLTDVKPSELPGYSEFLSHKASAPDFARYPHKAHRFLLRFRQSAIVST